MGLRKIVLLGLICGLVACGPSARLDGSSEASLKASLERVRSSVPADRRDEFDSAWAIVAMDAAFPDGDFSKALQEDSETFAANARARLNGKSATDIIALANSIKAKREEKERQQAIGEISELSKKRADAQAAQAELAKFTVSRSRFYVEHSGFGISQPKIALTVTNGTTKPVSRAYFRGVIASPGRSVPWLKEDFNYAISGGLEPGETASWVLEPNMFGEWGNVNAPDDAVFTVEAVRLDGADGEPFADVESFSEEDKSRLEALTKQFGGKS